MTWEVVPEGEKPAVLAALKDGRCVSCYGQIPPEHGGLYCCECDDLCDHLWCEHDWLDRPESDSRECRICGGGGVWRMTLNTPIPQGFSARSTVESGANKAAPGGVGSTVDPGASPTGLESTDG